MTIQRIKDLPYLEEVNSFGDVNRELKRLRDSLQEDKSERIQDFDMLQLSNVPWIDVREYGAKGDSTTNAIGNDDTVAIQAAIDVAQAGGQTVYFPDGFYGITANLTLSDDPIKITGDNRRRSIIKVFSTGGIDAIFKFNDSSQNNFFEFRDLYLSCYDKANYAIYSTKISSSIFENIMIEAPVLYGIYAQSGWNNDFIKVISRSGVGGMYLDSDINANNLIGVKIYDNSGIGLVVDGGTALNIEGCTIESNAEGGIVLDDIRGYSIKDSYFESNGDQTPVVDGEDFAVCIGKTATCYAGSIENNYIRGRTTDSEAMYGIELIRAEGLDIKKNYFYKIGYAYNLSSDVSIKKVTIADDNTYNTITNASGEELHAQAATVKDYAVGSNKFRIPGLFSNSDTAASAVYAGVLAGNLIDSHPVTWSRTVTGASVATVVAGHHPVFTMERAGGETCTLQFILDTTSKYKSLRGKYVTGGVVVRADGTGNFTVNVEGQTVTREVRANNMVYIACTHQLEDDEASLSIALVATSSGIEFTIENVFLTSGTEPVPCFSPLPLEGSLVWNPANLIDGTGETSSAITVVGAAVGDAVIVYPPYDMRDITYSGYVQAADTVEIRIQNESTAARDFASGTWKVKVWKH